MGLPIFRQSRMILKIDGNRRYPQNDEFSRENDDQILV